MLRIGLTGGIGSGKSSVALMLKDLGAVHIDADLVGHASYISGSDGFKKVVKAFGEDIIGNDGEIDRAKLGPLVFSDANNLSILNSILHPIIHEMIKAELDKMENHGNRVSVVEAAILIEAGWQSLFDEIWVVDAHSENVLERIMDRNKVTREQALERVESQIGREERNSHGDVLIENNRGLLELEKSVSNLWNDRIFE